jgi:hypothetical protein
LLSMLSVTHSQLQSKNIAWKIPEINNSCFKLHTILVNVLFCSVLPKIWTIPLFTIFIPHVLPW